MHRLQANLLRRLSLRRSGSGFILALGTTIPMYTIPPAIEAALDTFVADAIAKYKAGTCGKK